VWATTAAVKSASSAITASMSPPPSVCPAVP